MLLWHIRLHNTIIHMLLLLLFSILKLAIFNYHTQNIFFQLLLYGIVKKKYTMKIIYYLDIFFAETRTETEKAGLTRSLLWGISTTYRLILHLGIIASVLFYDYL